MNASAVWVDEADGVSVAPEGADVPIVTLYPDGRMFLDRVRRIAERIRRDRDDGLRRYLPTRVYVRGITGELIETRLDFHVAAGDHAEVHVVGVAAARFKVD